MTLSRLWNGLRWAAQIEVWTTAIALGLAAVLVIQLISIPFGGSSIVLSPRGTVEALYQAAQDGDYERAYSLLDEQGRGEVAAMGASTWRAMADELSQDRTISGMTYGSQRNYGRNVVLGMLIDYEDGTLRPATEELVREGREWRVMWPPGSRSFAETVRKYEPWFGY